MKSEGLIVTVVAGVAVVFLYLFSKKTTTTPIVVGATSPNTTAATLAASGGIAASIAKLFQPSNSQQAIDASVGYTPNAPPLAAGLGTDDNFTPVSTYTGPAYGPGVDTTNLIDAAVPNPVYADSDLLNSI